MKCNVSQNYISTPTIICKTKKYLLIQKKNNYKNKQHEIPLQNNTTFFICNYPRGFKSETSSDQYELNI